MSKVELRAAKIPSPQESLLITIGYWYFIVVKTKSFRNVIDGRYGKKLTATNRAGATFIRIFWLPTKALTTGHHD